MDEELVRLLLELPIREVVRREHRCPPSLDHPRLDEAQADAMELVVREVLDGVDLSTEQHELGLRLAAAALRRAAGESEHYDQMVTGDHQRPPALLDQQS